MESNEYKILRSMILKLNARIDSLEAELAKKESRANADNREASLREIIADLDASIQELNEKLSIINLPKESRFYFHQSEVDMIRNLVSELMSLKAETNEALKMLLNKMKYIDTLQ